MKCPQEAGYETPRFGVRIRAYWSSSHSGFRCVISEAAWKSDVSISDIGRQPNP